MRSAVYETLLDLRVVDPDMIEDYAVTVRDRPDISVKRCRRSGVIFLASTEHVNASHYVEKDDDTFDVKIEDDVVLVPELEDTARRAPQFSRTVRGKKWLDFGTGRGLILDALKNVALSTAGVELNAMHRKNIAARGHAVARSIEEFPEDSFDVMTMFHVLEHLEDQVGTLKAMATRLVPGGSIIIEVPHARDALLELYQLDSFKRFTLWSEHLVLHTRESLRAVVEAAGLLCDAVVGYQRFPVSNHLYWLRRGEPGGHVKWSFLDTPPLNEAYAAALERLDQTDSLIVYARKS